MAASLSGDSRQAGAGCPALAAPPALRLLVGGGAAEALLLGPLLVQGEQAGQDLVAEVVGPAVAVRLLLRLAASLIFLLLFYIIEEEITGRLQVGPAIGVEDGPVHRGVQLAQAGDAGRALVGIVEAVVGLRQALVVPLHEVGAELVVFAAGLLKLLVNLKVNGEGERLEAVGGRVAETILQRGGEEASPYFMGAGLQDAKSCECRQTKHNKLFGEDDP